MELGPELARAADPRPRARAISLPLPCGTSVTALDDLGSDRLRCDHPPKVDGALLGDALLDAARRLGRGRVVVLAPAPLAAGLVSAGFEEEARMPGFYAGREACAVLGRALDPSRAYLVRPAEVERVDALLRDPPPPRDRGPAPRTERATIGDAPAIAALVAATFAQYPTPTGDPKYVARQILSGTPFRVVREQGRIVAAASADLVREARTAELTDCATLPEARGRGLMQALLGGLMDDLRALAYPTAFTLARAGVPGVNLAFLRHGFAFRGRMAASCRIGAGIEDMNVWSRRLDEPRG